MGDASHARNSLQKEQYRLGTFGDHGFPIDKKLLAKAGFYYTKKGDDVKCFECHLEVDTKKIKASDDIAKIHKEKSPTCNFAQNLTILPKPGRSKTFLSYDSLRFEEERLETFIEWPLKWLHPEELAADGFYYLRTADHCACVFCRGIVGAWEVGDTPRGEHQRHFPHCPFIRGQPVGNVPLSHSSILARLPSQENPSQRQTNSQSGTDVCGTPRLMAGSYPECRGAPNKNEISLDEIGLPQYSGPKRKDYLTTESRLTSFVRWPDGVCQKPNELAEAGFFYCGLSDHVRCFHCGNGLRNWEKDDIPWNEHARWYPDCSYVLLKKGQDFIDKVRREKPPYIRTAPTTKPSTSKASSPSSKSSAGARTLSDQDLDPLMDLDIIRGVLGMGFPTHTVREALKEQVEQTGMPFFSMEPCIEAVLQKMEEERRQAIQSNVEDEVTESQAAKIQSAHSRSEAAPSANIGSSNPSSSVSHLPTPVPTTSSASESVSEDTTGILPTLPAPSSDPGNSADLPTLPVQNDEVTGNNTTTTDIQQTPEDQLPEDPSHGNTVPIQRSNEQVEEMEVDETGTGVSQGSRSNLPPMEQVIMQADEVMSMAEEALKAPNSGPSSLSHSDKVEGEGENTELVEQASTSGVKQDDGAVLSPQSSKELADELERIRDSRMCKVCMDAEMDVVFLPCAHMIACASCAVALTQCPICRKDIRYTIKPIVS